MKENKHDWIRCEHDWQYITTIKHEYNNRPYGGGSHQGIKEAAIFQCKKCSTIKKIKIDD